MAITAHSATLRGVDATPVQVEVDLLRRLPGVCIVGLANGAVRESAERVRSALAGAGEEFPRKRVVVNLAPAGLRKDGACFDLAIAVGILAADARLPSDALERVLLAGELSLGGQLRGIRGAVSLALLARETGRTLILPEVDAAAAAVVPGADVRGARDLAAVLAHLRGEDSLPVSRPAEAPDAGHPVDLAEVRGQPLARRALEIAAAGGHHLMLLGPPGCGKSMLARRLPTVLPEPTAQECLEITRVHGAAGLLRGGVVTQRPFRAPHHSVTAAALVGDRTLRPGEASLAHQGVLFLDEAAEFRRVALESLRAPLEDGEIRVSRAEGAVVYPAAVLLVLAANPCPCGFRGGMRPCRCTDAEVHRYRAKLSGPILDRIDLHVDLAPVPPEELLRDAPGESSAEVRTRVAEAVAFRRSRHQAVPNGRLDRATLDRVAEPTPDARAFLLESMRRLGLSGRGATRVLKVARTLADLAASPAVEVAHVAEAVGLRPRSEPSLA